jgi:hypothetical protein
MFREANAVARQFTWPIVLSKVDGEGKCTAGIGSFVVVNTDGWIVTAYHILNQFLKLQQQTVDFRSFEAEHAKLQSDLTLDKRERQKAIRNLKWPAKTDATAHGAWWGRNGVQITKWAAVPIVDLAIAKLEPFDPAWVTTYPTFKDPSKDFEPGVSLCKLGFPFHTITPIWDAAKGQFELPPGALPLPLFPIDGIFTRTVMHTVPANTPAPAYPLQSIETSSPGLRGQSGGPTFDTKGTIWAIQSRTAHYALGFDHAGGKDAFFNVGLGVHPATMLPFFDANGVQYELSKY